MRGSQSRNTSRDSYEKDSLVLRPRNCLKLSTVNQWIFWALDLVKTSLTFARVV